MKPYFAIVLAAAVGVLSACMLPAQAPEARTQLLSGPWECVDRTGVHGIFFEGSADRPSINVYERRKGETLHAGYFIPLPTDSDGNRVTLNGYRLTIHFVKSPANRPSFDLDLAFDPARDRWTGFWSDCHVEGGAVLDRPRPLIASSPHRLVGDWNEEITGGWRPAGSPTVPPFHPPGASSVLHIRQSNDGQLMTWLTNYEGNTTKLQIGLNVYSVTLTPHNYFGRSRRYEGSLSANRNTITGQWISEGLGTSSTVYRRLKPTAKPARSPQ
jgi:hypothetical protein